MPLNINGYTAHIRCEGKELQAYDIQNEDAKTVTCWVASEEGKVRSCTTTRDTLHLMILLRYTDPSHQTFTIHWGDESAAATMMICAYVDGRLVVSCAHETRLRQHCDGVYELGRTRAFVFSPLVLTGLCDRYLRSQRALTQELSRARRREPGVFSRERRVRLHSYHHAAGPALHTDGPTP